MSPTRRAKPFGRSASSRSPERDASARAVRARDHLEKKRERERRRLERERAREEIAASRKRVLRIAAPVGFVVATLLGLALARPVAEHLWLRDAPLARLAVQGTRALSPATIAAATGAWAGQPLANVDPRAVAQALSADPWIAHARVLRWPGGTLVVAVEEREAVARWRVGDRTELVDPRGGRFAGAVEPVATLPLVEGETLDGEHLPPEALEILGAIAAHDAFEVWKALQASAKGGTTGTEVRLHLPTLTTDAEGVLREGVTTNTDALHAKPDPADALVAGGYVIQLGDDGPRALLGRRRFAQRVARLATLLEKETDAAASARWIDLRYADRAVLRADSTSG